MGEFLIALVRLAGFVFTIALLLRVLLGWINVSPYQNEFAGLLYRITDPVLEPIRRRLPSVGMLDISPLIAMILVNILEGILIMLIGGIF